MNRAKQFFLDNAEWLLLILGFISITVEIVEFFLDNPQNYISSEIFRQIPMGFFMFTLLFYIIRILKGASRRTD